MPDIQKADPMARRRAFLILSVAAVIGAAGVLLFERYRAKLERLIEDHADVLLAHPAVAAAALVVLTLPLYAATIALWRLGAAVVTAQRFPPPGQPVVRNTVVLRGWKAVYRGRVIQVLASVLLLAGLSLPLVVWYILWSLGRAA